MAYALGNDWHMGPEGEKWKPRIAVHEIQAGEIKSFKWLDLLSDSCMGLYFNEWILSEFVLLVDWYENDESK